MSNQIKNLNYVQKMNLLIMLLEANNNWYMAQTMRGFLNNYLKEVENASDL